MISNILKIKEFNIILILLIALWISTIVYALSDIILIYINPQFTIMTAISSALIALVCLPLSIAIYRSNTDREFRQITIGLVKFLVIVVISGIMMFVLPDNFNVQWLIPAGQLLWFAAYAAIIIPLYSRLNLLREKLDSKIDYLMSAMCIIATVIIVFCVISEFPKLSINGFNILVLSGFVILDIILMSLLSKLMLIKMPNMYRHFFTILFIFFLLYFFTDIANLTAFFNMGTAVDITYNSPIALIFTIVRQVFLTSALILFLSRNINPESVEEVKATLQDTRCMINDLIAQSPDAMCICNVGGTPITMNEVFCRVFGVDVKSPENSWHLNLFDGTLTHCIPYMEFSSLKTGCTVILPVVKCQADERYLSIKVHPSYTVDRQISGYVVVAEDITERILAEQQVNDSLEEKKILLKEIHHRVKNNLQIVSSLLNVQSSYIIDPDALVCFKESQQRVKSMALIHERLYQSQDFAKVDFLEYINNLSRFLFSSYNVSTGRIGLNITVDNIRIDIDRAIPCGLILNELLSNSLRHAFPDGLQGEISIRLAQVNDQYLLVISDTGIGFPEETDHCNTKSLGMQLVNTLVSQLEGSMDLDRSAGTQFTICFPAAKNE